MNCASADRNSNATLPLRALSPTKICPMQGFSSPRIVQLPYSISDILALRPDISHCQTPTIEDINVHTYPTTQGWSEIHNYP
jgi:hypothetical protein